jgi:hypothetical protein
VAARQRERPTQGQVEAVEAGIHFIEVDAALARAAGAAAPPSLRSLDAIHLASTMSVSDELDALSRTTSAWPMQREPQACR